jgi:hypothetical protein
MQGEASKGGMVPAGWLEASEAAGEGAQPTGREGHPCY